MGNTKQEQINHEIVPVNAEIKDIGSLVYEETQEEDHHHSRHLLQLISLSEQTKRPTLQS